MQRVEIHIVEPVKVKSFIATVKGADAMPWSCARTLMSNGRVLPAITDDRSHAKRISVEAESAVWTIAFRLKCDYRGNT